MTVEPGVRSPFGAMAAQLAACAPAGQVVAGPAAGLPPGARYLGRFVGVSHALVAHGVPMLEAAELAGRRRKPKPAEVRHTLPADAPRLAGCTLIVRRMPGNHAEAWADCSGPAPHAAPIQAVGQGPAR